MSTANRKSSRKYTAKKKDAPEKPLSRFQPGANPILEKPTLKKKAE